MLFIHQIVPTIAIGDVIWTGDFKCLLQNLIEPTKAESWNIDEFKTQGEINV